MHQHFEVLGLSFKGSLYYKNDAVDHAQLMAYSTDASVYQEKPLAVAIPRDTDDIRLLIEFATMHSVTLIPRAAGTSLAGQVVGNGIVVDISIHFNQIKEINVEENWVIVQPGVIRDDLNHVLRQHGLMFGPETSTANRAMIGGMVGNNSCGLHSIVWGAVRDHLLEANVLLSDGSEVLFKQEEISYSASPHDLKSRIYNELIGLLSDKANRGLIQDNFPKEAVVRRNSGYALDSLIAMYPFSPQGHPFNICSVIAGSEGTLVFITEVKLRVIPLPPKETVVICVHCHSIDEALRANIIALQYRPMASELVDKFIMDFTIGHPEYHKNRFFIEGDPEAMLMVEFMEETASAADSKAAVLIARLKQEALGYAYRVLYNEQTKFAWEVRKAGLGLLRNLKGDKQPVNLIEDCAVAPEELPMYIRDLQQILSRHDVQASYYAHAGAGELHVEPMIDLKTKEGLAAFRSILADTAHLVKKYKGSLSGEHGDGRLRGEFIPAVVGNETYALFKSIKQCFDPHNIFNAGKIVNTPRMESNLRVKPVQKTAPVKTHFNFSAADGILHLAEKCSGSGDCRKSAISGGVMCPSYMATRQEKDTTRARANVLRQFLSNEHDLQPFNHKEIKEVMDLCLSCKGCKTECPSGVDVAKMKAEFLQHYYDHNGTPSRAKMIGNFTRQMQIAALFPWAWNMVFRNNVLRKMANRLIGFHPERTIPLLHSTTLRAWHGKRKITETKPRTVFLFCDEFTNYNDVEIGKKAILLLEAIGFNVEIPEHLESGRTWLSKGLVRKAKEIANRNIGLLADRVSATQPLIGIEPSAILTFRDEYIDLAEGPNLKKAVALSKNVFTIEEFIAREAGLCNIDRDIFTNEAQAVSIHGHCYQKSLSSQDYIKTMVSLPQNYTVSVIPSGCCGMAGSFGYENEHYEISNKIGEQILFPAIRKLNQHTLIVASGTSCRHQIKDGTNRYALHPVEVLFNALRNRL
jgi:FAD/FMN-containing dehydrogenase/Fe-S oxidoreductase